MLKKLIASLSALVVVATSIPGITTAQSMYASDPEFVDALAWMYDNGLTMFNDVNAYRSSDLVTREQAAKFVSQFRTNVLTCAVTSPACDGNFADLSSADATLQSSINQACELGLMKGSNGMFMPKSKLTRAQLFTVLIRALEGSKDESVEPRWDNYFTAAAARGITSENDTYAQGRSINRYEAALMLYRARNACNTGATVGDDLTTILAALLGSGSVSTGSVVTTPVGNSTANGNLTLAVASDTPGVQYVPGTSTNIRALKLNLTAGTTDASINSLNVTLKGLVDRVHIDGVYVTDAMYMPLTNVRTFGTDYKANLNFPGGMLIPAGTTKSVYVVIDTNGSTNERFTVSVESPADVVSAGTVGGTFPLVSNEINTTQYVAPNITFNSQTNTLSTTCTNKYYIGDTNKQLARFTLQSQNTNRGINLMAVRLRTTKNLQGIVSNLKLKLGDGTAVSTSYVIDGKYVVFFTNYTLPYGTSRQFYVYGDIVGGDTNDMIQFYLDGSRDVVAFEADTNSPISVIKNSSYISQDYCIANGKTTLSKDPTSVGNSNISRNRQGVVGVVGNLFVKSEMNVDKIRVYAKSQASAGGLAFAPTCATTTTTFPRSIDQVQLLVDGKIVDTDTAIDMSSCTMGYGYLEFSLFNTLTAGNHTFAVKFDTDTNAVLYDQVQFYVDPSSIAFGNNAEYVSNGTTVLTTDIAGSVQSAIFTVNQSSIQSVSRSDGFGSGRKLVAGTEKYKAFTYKVEANNIRPLVLNGLTVNLQNMTTSDNPFVTEVAITVDGMTGVVAVESVSCAAGVTTCVVPFTSLGITIPQGGSRNINFHVTTTNGYVGALAADMVLTVPTSSLDVDDSEGNTAAVPAGLSPSVSSVMLNVSSASNVQISTMNNTVNKIIPANGNEYAVGTFTITSTDDSNTLKSLVLVNYPSSCTSTNPHVVTTNGSLPEVNGCVLNANTNGGTVNLYDSAGNLVGSSTISTNGTVVFDPLNFALPYAVAKTLTVKVAFPSSTIQSAAETNKEVNLAMLHPGSQIVLPGGSTAQTLIESTTNTSVTATASYNNNPLLNNHVVRKTIISVSSVANPSAGTDSLVSLRGQTQAVLFATNIIADAANSANIYSITFNVNAGGGYTISASPAYTLKIDGNVLSASDVTCTTVSPVVCTFVPSGSYPNGYTISAGSSVKFELVQNGAPMAPSTAGQSLSTTINEAAGATVAANIATAVTPATIVWSDNSDTTTSLMNPNRFSDYGVETLPTSAWVFSDN